MDNAPTVTSAVNQLEREGYDTTFKLDSHGIHCQACQHSHMPERLDITHTFRFEGATNPEDQAIVLGVRCPGCGAKGVIVSAYGPDADPELFELLNRLTN